jgi:hypothetical protein
VPNAQGRRRWGRRRRFPRWRGRGAIGTVVSIRHLQRSPRFGIPGTALAWPSGLTYLVLEDDWERFAALVAGGSRSATVLISPDGALSRGLGAFRHLAKLLPPLWPAVPILYFPLPTPVGTWLYGRVAASRKRLHCTAEACAI